jgi:hypothetical protein
VQQLAMNGESHQIIVTPGSGQIDMASKRDRLSKKIGHAVSELSAQDPKPEGAAEQIDALKRLGGTVRAAEKAAGKGGAQQVAAQVAEAVHTYGVQFGVGDVDEPARKRKGGKAKEPEPTDDKAHDPKKDPDKEKDAAGGPPADPGIFVGTAPGDWRGRVQGSIKGSKIHKPDPKNKKDPLHKLARLTYHLLHPAGDKDHHFKPGENLEVVATPGDRLVNQEIAKQVWDQVGIQPAKRGEDMEEKLAFEARLGHYAGEHKLANQAADSMCQKARAYLDQRPIDLQLGDAVKSLDELYLACGTPADMGFAGAIGKDAEKIKALFAGKGALREKMNHVTQFVEKILMQDLVQHGYEKIKEIASQAKLNMQRLRARGAKVEHEKERRDDKGAGLTGEHAAKMGYAKVGAIKDDMRRKNKGQSHWSQTTREAAQKEGESFIPKELAEEHLIPRERPENEQGQVRVGLELSPLEQASVNKPKEEESPGQGREFLPWMEGERAWLIRYASKYAQVANELGIPLMAGVSGTTGNIMDSAKLLKVGPPVNVRLAALGYLIPIHAHSFHEIMVAAKHFGCPYSGDGDYTSIAPLTAAEIQALNPPKKKDTNKA